MPSQNAPAEEHRSPAVELALSETWQAFDGVHGGYLAALVAACVSNDTDGLPLRSLQASFLRAMRGPLCHVRTQQVRRGRTTACVSATATGTDGRGDALTALLLLGGDGEGPEYPGSPMPTDRGPDECGGELSARLPTRLLGVALYRSAIRRAP